jgi:voltage-gated sodium channel
MTSSNVSVIRSVRLLRTLRTISSVPSMSGLVKNLIGLVPAMGNMLVLFGFTVLIFATIAM